MIYRKKLICKNCKKQYEDDINFTNCFSCKKELCFNCDKTYQDYVFCDKCFYNLGAGGIRIVQQTIYNPLAY